MNGCIFVSIKLYRNNLLPDLMEGKPSFALIEKDSLEQASWALKGQLLLGAQPIPRFPIPPTLFFDLAPIATAAKGI